MIDQHPLQQSLTEDRRPSISSGIDSVTPQASAHRAAKTSLANITVPSFSAFRAQVSGTPSAIAYRSQLPAPSPRHYSFAAEPSPRLFENTPRPLSIATVIHKEESVYVAQHSRNSSTDSHDTARTTSLYDQHHSRETSMNNSTLKPSMRLNGVQRTLSNESLSSTDTSDKRPKSPGRLGSIFGWNKASTKNGTESPTTTFSDRSLSPQPSPRLDKVTSNPMTRLTPPTGLDIDRANNSRIYDSPHTPIMIDTPGMSTHVQELERELAHVSAELAGSIKREMDLEDEIDRLRMELPSIPPSEMSRRGSDYFSDSGAGSVRYPISDPDAKIEEVERLRRKAEQEKGQMKLDVAQKTQEELARRRDLEEHIHNLEQQLSQRSQEESERKDRRVEELEAQLEDTRRRLNQEKEAKENFEDLYTALQSDYTSGRRGLGRGFGSIAEESEDSPSGLTRSSSLRNGGMRRSGSVKDRPEGRQRSGSQSTPVTAEGMKEVEDQRDALQKALKLLISRYEKQRKDHERHLKKLSRQQLVSGRSSQSSGYHQEVSVLKEEVTTLRKRTEDALEQKWQYEKSLGGIKMDLDRAEEETRGLRVLLQEHDIMAPSPRTLHSATFGGHEDIDVTLSAAENDREQAKRLAKNFRQRASQMDPKSPGIPQLQQAASRMDQLSQQFDSQAKTNNDLRGRLAAAVEKGEREQQSSTRQIEDMQKRLAQMEDSVLAAQQHSETTLTTHETEVRAIEESTSPRLQRLNVEVPEPGKLAPISPGLMRSRSPKRATEASLLDTSRTNMLERKVRELERLLRDAEDDMQHVVERVNKSQLEVAELTNERDAAFTQMRKLQDKLVEETERAELLISPSHYDGGNDSGSDYGD